MPARWILAAVMTVGFLHTASLHVATFDRLLDEMGGDAARVHVVDEALLERCRVEPTHAVRPAVQRRVQELVAQGVDVVCCTCSTIGGLAEAVRSPVPVIRVDRPMMRRAVELGGRIVVLAAAESTLVPTHQLLQEEANRIGVPLTAEMVTVAGAWDAFLRGDRESYLSEVAAAARHAARRADVLVLAQASMADALATIGNVGVAVLSSPRLAVEWLSATRRSSEETTPPLP